MVFNTKITHFWPSILFFYVYFSIFSTNLLFSFLSIPISSDYVFKSICMKQSCHFFLYLSLYSDIFINNAALKISPPPPFSSFLPFFFLSLYPSSNFGILTVLLYIYRILVLIGILPSQIVVRLMLYCFYMF